MAKIAEVIKYEGDNSTFIWKHPSEDFNSMTQLIVHESQEAVFFMDGQALDLFGPGRYTLDTQNIPLIGNFINRMMDGESPFHCEVYFINKTIQMAAKWGTPERIHYIDPEYGVPLDIGANGELNLQVVDSRKLLIKLVGTTNGIAWDNRQEGFSQSLTSAFRPVISMAVRSNLTAAIKEGKISLLEIDEHLETISEILRRKILPDFEEYGLTIPKFYLSKVDLPSDNDPNFKKIRDLYSVSLAQRTIQAEAEVQKTAAQAQAEVTAARRAIELEEQATKTAVERSIAEREIIKARGEAEAMKATGFAEAEIMRAKGYTEKDLIQAEVQKAYAEGIGNMGGNGGAGGSTMSDIVGLGIGLQAANAMSGQLGNIFSMGGANQQPQQEAPAASQNCAACGAAIPANAKFCLECGEKVAVPTPEGMIVCPSCGKTVTKGKFCLECGYKFITACPKCGSELPAGAKFCLECGEKI